MGWFRRSSPQSWPVGADGQAAADPRNLDGTTRMLEAKLEGPASAVRVVVATAAAYVVLASLMWEIDVTWGSAFWAAAGVTFAVLVRSPYTRWPALAVAIGTAEVSVNLLHGTSATTAFWGGVANVAEPLVGATLFRVAGGQQRLVGLRSFGWLLVCGVVVGPAIGAIFGGLLAVGGPAPPVERFVRWWVGDGVGVLAVAPALLAVRATRPARRPVELAGLLLSLTLVAGLLPTSGSVLAGATPYLAMPVLVWAALRFGVAGAAASATAVAAVAHAATATGHGVFAELPAGDHLTVAQIFIGSMALSALTVALLVEDVAARRRSESTLLHRATHDPLTDLANRALLEQRLADGDVGAVVVVDLDGFKEVNDAQGHAAGDAVLVEVARRLQVSCRPCDLVARPGGDEFVVVLSGIVPDAEVDALEERFRRALAEPIVGTPVPVSIEASLGRALADRDGAAPASLLLAADAAMYEAKRRRVTLN
jgi:diguanylate cyclase (GGDEF)-like protein